ncbi:MAG: asparagine synthetase B, partial [Dehalococcoidia bacterium]
MKKMCGICGINWSDKNLIQNMTNILQHRGPDQQGTFINDHVSLGSRRLSILDLSERGRQPIHNENESIFVVHNGEIYNFEEIKKILEKKGHEFYSNTDTEVVVHAYEQWGQNCVNKFNGMFAFAIWDSTKQELFLARDRLGIKPLFYFFDSEKFLFSSEIKSILLDPLIKKEIDPIALHYYLGYEYVPAPLTMFKGIKKLLPAHTLTFNKGSIT